MNDETKSIMESIPANRPLPVWEIIVRSFAILWYRRRRFSQALLVNVIISGIIYSGVMIGSDEITSDPVLEDIHLLPLIPMITVALMLVLAVLFAVTCHRLILMEDNAVARYGVLTWTRRETRFAGWILFFGLCGTAIVLVPSMLFFSYYPENEDDFGVIYTLCQLLYLLIFSRAFLILPATATDQRIPLSRAEALGKGNHWRLFLVLGVFPTLCFSVIDFLIPYYDSHVYVFINYILYLPFLVLEIILLSLSYQFLSLGNKTIE